MDFSRALFLGEELLTELKSKLDESLDHHNRLNLCHYAVSGISKLGNIIILIEVFVWGCVLLHTDNVIALSIDYP